MPLVDVNSASCKELKKTPGIRDAIVPRILAGRPFRDMKDLRDRVRGVGDGKEKTLPKYICFGPRPTSAPSISARSDRRPPRRAVSRQRPPSSPPPVLELVDINNASLEELMKLKGIKIAKAQLIIAARPFYRVDDLLGVKYITPGVLDVFRGRLVVGEHRPQQESRAIQARPPLIPAAMAASLTRRYYDPPDLYDYSDDDDTSGDDDYSDESDDGEGIRNGKVEEDEGEEETSSEQPYDKADTVFEGYLRQLREQSEVAAFAFNEWFETQLHRTPPPVPFTISSPPDSRFPVCRAIERDIREFVFRNQRSGIERVPSDHRYQVWTPQPRRRSPVIFFASWNVRNVSKSKSVCFLKKIADVINEFDLVALQEVRDERVLIRLKYLLPPGWNFIMSDPVGQVGGRQEYYAFLYRKRVVEPTDTWDLEATTDTDVLRPPFVAHFCSTPESGLPRPLELTLVNVHVCFGHVRERHREIAAIRGMVDDLATQIPSERRNVVVLGDFNVPPIEALGGTQASLAALIRPPLVTTVFGSLYDNIWIDPSTFGQAHNGVHVDACGVYRIDWRFYPHSKVVDGPVDAEATLQASHKPSESTESIVPPEQVAMERFKCAVELSDHCPVWAAFSITPTEATFAA